MNILDISEQWFFGCSYLRELLYQPSQLLIGFLLIVKKTIVQDNLIVNCFTGSIYYSVELYSSLFIFTVSQGAVKGRQEQLPGFVTTQIFKTGWKRSLLEPVRVDE